MIKVRLPDFANVVEGGTATLKVPRYLLTLQRIMLRLGGTAFDATDVSFIRLKIGARTVWSVETQGSRSGGTYLDLMNKYRGITGSALHLVIDLAERDFASVVAREIGGIDLSKLAEDVYIEVGISGSTAPTMYAVGYFTAPQGESDDPRQLMKKLVSVPFSFSAAGRFLLPFEPKGALLQRVHVFYGGTDWSSSADGNISKIEVKKNGLIVFDPPALDNRYGQTEYGKVPAAKSFTVDFVEDNNPGGALVTADARTLEFTCTLGASDSGIAYFEVLDPPNNL